MEKKYNYQEFKKDPRTYYADGKLARWLQALFDCIDHSRVSPESIFLAIDKIYSTGKHRSPSFIKYQKKRALELLDKFTFD